LVVAHGLLDRFAGGGRAREGADTREGSAPRGSRAVAELQPLLDLLERDELPPTTDLVITGLAAGRSDRNSLLTRLKDLPNSSIEEFRPPQREQLVRFIRDEGNARGIRWRTGASPAGARSRGDPVALLAERLQSDTMAIANELDKLALFTMGRETTAEDVDEICCGERESSVFNLVDAVMDGKVDAALGHLNQLRSRGASSQGILALVASSYRRLAIICDHLDEGASSDEIGKAIGLPWRGLRDAAISRARRHGSEGVRTAYRLIIAADRATKLGDVDEDLAIDLLVLRLGSLAPVEQRARRRSRTEDGPRATPARSG